VVEKGRVAIGKNPTSLAISKIDPENRTFEPLNEQVLVASRGDRKIQWVRFAADGNSGSVVRTLQDSRIVDPIAVEDADNFANDNMVLSIADYTGKAVSNYRYGAVVFANPRRLLGLPAAGRLPGAGHRRHEHGVRRQLHDGGPALPHQNGQRALIRPRPQRSSGR
jgi:hypothetical protein